MIIQTPAFRDTTLCISGSTNQRTLLPPSSHLQESPRWVLLKNKMLVKYLENGGGYFPPPPPETMIDSNRRTWYHIPEEGNLHWVFILSHYPFCKSSKVHPPTLNSQFHHSQEDTKSSAFHCLSDCRCRKYPFLNLPYLSWLVNEHHSDSLMSLGSWSLWSHNRRKEKKTTYRGN